MALVAEARSRGMEVVISALTIIEAVHARTNMSCLNRVLSGLRVVPVGDEEARAASKLLMDAGCAGTPTRLMRRSPKPRCDSTALWSC